MSVSKLESLPNEILADLLEKYINGIDILNAFAFQLNRRFDALISQSQRLCFDFMRCHKDHFRFCIGLLPAYINKIEELALSEQNTPGQIHAFLSFFPRFFVFKQLRKLYLHINVEAIQPRVLETVLNSLSKTTLDTLSIKLTKASMISSLNNVIVEIFRMKTLKKFSIVCDPCGMAWLSLNDISSNIKYLTIDGIFCAFEDLKYVFRCTSGLKYLNIKLTAVNSYNTRKLKSSSENSITRMSMLHTVIFKIPEHNEQTPIILEPYLRLMPSLHRLEIQTQNGFHGISIWETLLKTSLPKLTYFNLESYAFNLNDVDVNVLDSIQTPFWIGKRNFHIVIKSSSLLQGHYLNNVKHLIVHELNDNLFELLTTHVNCSRIKHLDVSFLNENNNRINILLDCTRSIIVIQMKWRQLCDDQFASLRECKNLKFVDISAEEHSFDETCILTIGNMFPHLEHLVINTQDLRNVPILQTYLPHLRSLTFASIEPNDLSYYNDYEQKMFDENLRQNAQFLFQRRGNWITVWTDQATFQDSYWHYWQNTGPEPIGPSRDWWS
jgi:hypothetical protein